MFSSSAARRASATRKSRPCGSLSAAATASAAGAGLGGGGGGPRAVMSAALSSISSDACGVKLPAVAAAPPPPPCARRPPPAVAGLTPCRPQMLAALDGGP